MPPQALGQLQQVCALTKLTMPWRRLLINVH